MNKFSKIFESESESKFKLGLDIHGVVDAMPETFAFLTKSIIESGGEVHIITGGSWNDELEFQLKNLNIKWTHSFSVYDHLIENNTSIIGEIQFEDGTIQKKFEGGAWDKVKGKYCADHKISLHLDDTLIYNDFFTTPFARIWTHNGKAKSHKKDLRHIP